MPRTIDVFLQYLLIVCMATGFATIEAMADTPMDPGVYADRVLLNGRVLTVDARDSIVQAGEIVYRKQPGESG